MSKAPPYWNKAKKYLSRKDIKMKQLIKNVLGIDDELFNIDFKGDAFR